MSAEPAPESLPEFDPLLPDQGPAPEKIKEPYRLTEEQTVSPPPYLRGKQLEAWLLRDLEEAIGPEYIDRDGSEQYLAKFLAGRENRPAPLSEPPKAPPGPPSQGELF